MRYIKAVLEVDPESTKFVKIQFLSKDTFVFMKVTFDLLGEVCKALDVTKANNLSQLCGKPLLFGISKYGYRFRSMADSDKVIML